MFAKPCRKKFPRPRFHFRSPNHLSVESLEDRRLLTVLPDGFTETSIVDTLDNPMAMALSEHGEIFIAEQGGKVRVIDEDGVLLPTPFVDLSSVVDYNGERGLLGIAFDPEFHHNNYVYVLYTQKTPSPHNHVARFTANGNVAVPGSEVPIFDIDDLNPSANFHNGGGIHFGIDGKLYITTGDNGTPTNAGSLGSMMGKMLRINPDGTIPADNPFFNQTTENAQAIYAKGLRNPFTFGIDPTNGRMLVNDVGAAAWEEVNEVVPGGDYGWPYTEGATTNPLYNSPLFTYPHGSGNAAGNAVTAGTFYYPQINQFGGEYLGQYFFADFTNAWIRTLDPVTKVSTLFASDTSMFTIDLDVDDGGALYYMTRGTGAGDGAIFKIENASGQSAPEILRSPSSQLISVSQTATFSVTVSGALPRTFQWQRNGVDIPGANSPSYTTPAVTMADNNSTYRVRITNSLGSATSENAILTVTSKQAPTANILTPLAGSTYRGNDTFTFSGNGVDSVSGQLPDSSLSWRVDFHHNDHQHPFIPTTTGVSSGSFTIPVVGETSPNVFYRVTLTVRDSIGLTTTTHRDITPQTSTMSFDTNIPGRQVYLDGEPIATPSSVLGVVGIERTISVDPSFSAGGVAYEFAYWSDGGAVSHTISTPVTNTSYTAFYREVPGWAVDEGQTSPTLDDIPYSIDVDYAGNTYVSGTSFVTNPADSNAGKGNIFISKYLPDGTTYFQTTLTGTDDARALGITQGYRGFFVVGMFKGTVDFDPGPGVKNVTSVGGYDLFVLKLSDEGLLRWVRRIGGAGDDIAYADTADKDLNLYIAGSFQGTVDFDPYTPVTNLTSQGGTDAFLLKIDKFGGFAWARSFGGVGEDRATALIGSTSGPDQVVVTGSFSGTADFDPGTGVANLTSIGGKDAFVARLDSDGNYSLAQRLGGRGDDEGFGVALDSDNNIYTAGDFTGTADFDPSPTGTRTLTSAGSTDVFISALNPTGAFKWVKQAGNSGADHAGGITVEKDSSISTIGDFTGTVDFNPHPAGVFNITSRGGRDAFVLRLTPVGDFDAVQQIGNANDDSGVAISHDFTTHLAVAGAFSNTITVNTGTSDVNLTSGGGRDIYAVKLDRSPGGAWRNDPPISVADVSVVEGNSGVINAIFPVTLAAPLAVDAKLDYAAIVKTAVPGKDFAPAVGTVVIPAGQTTASITVTVLGDTYSEAFESFKLVFSNPVNVKQPSAPAIGTILNDDPLPSLSIGDVVVVEGTGGTRNAVFTVTLSALSRQAITVNWATANGTATAGSDYTASSGTVTFPLTTLTQNFTVPITTDSTVEGDESFVVNLSAAVSATIATPSATATLFDDDTLPVLSVGDISGIEGTTTKSFVFPVTLSKSSAQPVTVVYTTSSATAISGTDFTQLTGTLTIPAGQTTANITVKDKGDTTVEADETFLLTLSSPTNARLGDATGVGSILNDDAKLSIGNVSLPEGNTGVAFANFPVTLSRTSPFNVTVNYQVYSGSAAIESDFAPVRGMLVIPAGQTSATIPVAVFGDQVYENNQTFTLKLSGSVNASVSTDTGTATISNDDAAPALTISNTSVFEGNSGTTYAAFSVTMPTPSELNTTVNYSTANGTATAGSDYVSASGGVLTIPAGQLSGTVLISVVGDITLESDETFSVTLSNPGNSTIATATAVATILDDEPLAVNRAPTGLTLSSQSVAELSPSGTLVGTLSTVDPDSGDTFVYSLVSSAGGRFAIVGSRLEVANGGLLDYDLAQSHNVTIRTTDSGGLTLERTFTVTVTPIAVNHAPTGLSLSGQSVVEESVSGTLVGTFTTADPDAGDSFAYTLVNNATGRFAISGNQLVVANGSLLDYNLSQSHNVIVRTTDGGGLALEKTFTITVTPATQTFAVAAGQGSVTPDDEGRALAVDSAGNSYVAGTRFFADSTSDSETVATSDIYLVKYGPDGDLLWQSTIGSTGDDRAYGITLDASGNVYVTGAFSGTVDFDASSSTTNLTSLGGLDVFVLKLSAGGAFQWARRWGGTSTTGDIGYGIAIDAAGNVLVTGQFASTVDFDPSSSTFSLKSTGDTDVFVEKLTSAGNFVWAARMGSTSADVGMALATDASNRVYVTGLFRGSATFGGTTLVARGNSDAFVERLNSDGAVSYAVQLGGTGTDEGGGIAVDSGGNVYSVGYFNGTGDFDPGSATVNLTSGGSADIFLSKLDGSGNFSFAKRIGGSGNDRARAIALDGLGNLAVVGFFSSKVDFDPNSGTTELTSAGSSDAFLVELTTAGDFSWASRFGSTSTDISRGVDTDAQGRVYVTGQFSGTVGFNTNDATFNLQSSGGGDQFLVKVEAPTGAQIGMAAPAPLPVAFASVSSANVSSETSIAPTASATPKASATVPITPRAADAVFAQASGVNVPVIFASKRLAAGAKKKSA